MLWSSFLGSLERVPCFRQSPPALLGRFSCSSSRSSRLSSPLGSHQFAQVARRTLRNLLGRRSLLALRIVWIAGMNEARAASARRLRPCGHVKVMSRHGKVLPMWMFAISFLVAWQAVLGAGRSVSLSPKSISLHRVSAEVSLYTLSGIYAECIEALGSILRLRALLLRLLHRHPL